MKPPIVVACLLLATRTCVAAMPYWYWYATSEEIDAYEGGKVPTLACPLGAYRDFRGGLRRDGCTPCPPGRYGSSTRLTSSRCTGACPLGTYLDSPGGESADDCRPCPRGTYGDARGLATRECSGACSDLNTAKAKFHGVDEGLTSKGGCRACPKGILDARGQCDSEEEFLEGYAGEMYRQRE